MKKRSKIWSGIKTLFLVGVVFVLLGVVGLLGAFAYYSKDLPSPDKINMRQVAESTKIFDSTGQTLLYEIHGPEKRTIVPLSEITPFVKQGTIAIEDEDFYSHYGIDPGAILRAFWANFKGGEIQQGGSTITQQLIKNSILTPEKKYSRKFKEIILSLQTERKFSKDQILQMYLNEIPYGANIYGIESAAQSFFNKSAKELSLAESALLAGLPKAPTYYSPYGSHRDELKNRQEAILNKMAQLDFVGQKKANQAKQKDLDFALGRDSIVAPHFVLYVKEQLVDKYGEEVLQKEGLRVTTTLDTDLQTIADQVVADYPLEDFEASNAALVAIDPKTGHILAMKGSRDYFDKSIDGNVNVALRPRQPGSSFKPFVYTTAFKGGFSPDNLIWDVETNFGVHGSQEYIPQNYSEKFRGPVTFRHALSASINVPSVKVLYLAGVKDSIKTAEDMGITTLTDPQRYGLSLVLGGGEVKLLEEAAAYGVFANDGIKHEKIAILKVEDKNGQILFEEKTVGKRVLDKQIARQITNVITRHPQEKPRNAYYFKDITVAAKTGTTQGYRDAWTVGYVPSLVAGVWVGNNDNSPMVKKPSIRIATPLWHAFMKEVLADQEITPFKSPESVEKKDLLYQLRRSVKIDKISGKLATELTPPGTIETKEFIEPHTALYYLDKSDSQFGRWEEGVQKWIEENPDSFEAPPTEEDDVHVGENKPGVKIEEIKIKDDSVRVELDIESEFEIEQADFFLEGDLMESDSRSPFITNFPRPQSGQYQLEIKVYDVKGNQAEIGQVLEVE